AERSGACNVRCERVADEQGRLGLDLELRERPPVELGIGLAPPHLRGEKRHVDALSDAEALEVAVQEVRRIEGIRDETERETALAQRLEQGMRRCCELRRRRPRRMLRLEEAQKPVV